MYDASLLGVALTLTIESVRPRVLVVLVLVPLACSSAEALDGDAGGALVDAAPPAPDHAAPIALPGPVTVRPLANWVTPAALEDTDAGPRSVIATNFEAASAACNDWEAQGADAIRSVPPHTGDYACRVCSTGESPDLALERSAGPLAAGRYALTAWLRKRPHRDAPGDVTASLEADTEAGVVGATSEVALGDAYAEVLVPIDLPRGATSIRVRIGAVAMAAQCVLVDDVVLARAP